MSIKTTSTSSHRSSQGSGADCKPLLEVATKDIFRHNVFRITGLPVDATAREVAKHAGNLKVMEELGQGAHQNNHVFSHPRPTMDQIREAIQTIKDPERRLVDEFFWFWPREFGKSATDPALQALAKGELQEAYNIWGTYENDPKDGVVATHNMALTTQIIALDREHMRIARAPSDEPVQKDAGLERSDTEDSKIEYYWQRSFKRWQRLVGDDRLWDRVTVRVRQIDDPRLRTGFVRGMRASLPEAFDKINAELALSYAQAGKLELARLHIRYMRELNQGIETVEKIAELVLSPVKVRLREQVGRAKQQIEKTPSNGPKAAKQLLDEAQRCLPLFDLFLGNDHESRNDLFDDVASVCNLLVVAYHKQTRDDTTCQAILKTVLPLATAIDLRSRLEKNIGIFSGNLRLKEVDGIYALLKVIQDSGDSARSKYERFNAEALPSIMKIAGVSGVSASFGLLGGDSEQYAELLDSAAVVLRGISVDAWNEDNDSQTALTAIDLALQLVRDTEHKKRMQDDKQKLEQMRERQVSQAKAAKLEAERREREQKIKRTFGWIAAVVFVALMIWGSQSSNTNTSSGSSSPTPPSQPSSYTPPSLYNYNYTPPVSTTPGTYRVPSHRTAELNRDSQAIDLERANIDALKSSVNALKRDIESSRLYLNRTSEYDVDQFNEKVNRYNAMLERLRGRQITFNQMVDDYNDKLHRYAQ